MPTCVLAEAERRYGAHGVPFFTGSVAIVNGKKNMGFPKEWQKLPHADLRLRRRNMSAVCVIAGAGIVVVDADGADAIAVVERLLVSTGIDARTVPQVQTQRGPNGRHYYFAAAEGTAAWSLTNSVELVIDGQTTKVDIRAGCNGAGTGCVIAPPTKVVGGGEYKLLPGPEIHQAPAMPDALARVLGAGGGKAKSSVSTTTTTAVKTAPTATPVLVAAALRDAIVRAGTDAVGAPVSVKVDAASRSVRVKLKYHGTRICPVSRNEHVSNGFNVIMRADQRTGLPSLFVYCHSKEGGCKDAGHQMLSVLGADEADAVYAEAGIEMIDTAPPRPSLGEAAAVVGKAQEALDRLLENPRGAWATVETLSVIACALCTAAGGHEGFMVSARSMLRCVLDATALGEGERALVERAFQPSRTPLAPVATLRGFAAGLIGKREQELMLVREAIVECTDPALEADIDKAADALLRALETQEYRQSDGKVKSYSDVEQGGLFVFYTWHRVTRLAFDKWQTATEKKHELYLFNGATFKSGQKDTFVQLAYTHFKRVAEKMREVAPLQSRAEKLVMLIADAGDYFSRLTKHALATMQNSEVLEQCGLMSPEEFHDKLDTGAFIGFTNGVYDTSRDVFMPRGKVGHNVLVSMTTKYAYISPDDPRAKRACGEILAYYATLFAADAADPDDALVLKARMMVGSYLYPSNVAKKIHVYLGHQGNNGKSAFAEFLRRTLGDYYVTGNLSALTPGPRETLDVEIIRNHKALVCSFPEAQSSDRASGHSLGLKLDSAKLKVMTGNDTVCARGLYQNPRNVGIKHKPLVMSNTMPELDHSDEAARGRVRVSLFGSQFSKTTEDHARRIYRCIPDLNAKLEEWAPFHMLLMLEWLRAFVACEMELPAGDEHTEGSYAHRAVALQTPEGKLREWVEERYVHVPLKEKDTGTKLEALYAVYTTAIPPVHAKMLGRNTFAHMLTTVYPSIGPHQTSLADRARVYLIR